MQHKSFVEPCRPGVRSTERKGMSESESSFSVCESRACFKKNSWLHISTEIFPSWLFIPKIRWNFFATFFQLSIPRHHPFFLPISSEKHFNFIPQKILLPCLVIDSKHGCFSTFLHPCTPSPLIHHSKSSLSSLHIFVHYCTFCASLHVKTSPAATNVNMW